MIEIRSILTENDLAGEFISDFREGRLSEKFFYWFPLSVRAWLALCSDGAYRNYVRSRSLIARTAGEVASLAPEGSLELLSLGSGQGDKDLILLEELSGTGRRVAYRPVDASQALLEMACEGALGAGFPTKGVKADITRDDHLAALARDPGDRPRMVALLGNTLGALDPLATAERLRRLLRPGDVLLVDGEVHGGEETMAGYDNPLNRDFAWAPLRAVGIGEGDGELRFEMAADPRRPGLHLIPKHFRARRAVRVRLGGEELGLEPGERLEMGHSYKYARETFLEILNEAGMEVPWHAVSDDGRFVMAVATPRG